MFRYDLDLAGLGTVYRGAFVSLCLAGLSLTAVSTLIAQSVLNDVVLSEKGGSVRVRITSASGEAISNGSVLLLASTARLEPISPDSWRHHRRFRQRVTNLSTGIPELSGVPSGAIIVPVRIPSGFIEERAVVSSGEEVLLASTSR